MKNTQTHIAACIVTLDKTATAIQLFPAGTFTAPQGSLKGSGPWHLDATSAAQLIAVVASRQHDILVDYEHQSLQAAQNGKPAPAAAWLKSDSLVWNADGLFATNPDWKEAAAAMIAADEYRYISPVFTYDPKTGVPLDILSVALTNTPAIDGMAAVSLAAAMASALSPQETPMEKDEIMERLCYLLNLPITTTAQEMAVQLDKLKAMLGSDTATTAATSLFDVLADKDSQIAALSTQKPNPAEFVPVAVMSALQTEVAALRAEISGDKVTKLVDAALSTGKLLPAQKDWAIGLGKTDIAALTAYLDTAQPIAALAENQTKGKQPLAAATLDAEWQNNAGLQNEFASASDYAAYRRAEQAGQIKTTGAK